ncbi:MAG: SOS response-associated peptidase [Candidatus Marinimicrobia bacterium]|nr:SOS response-associated peptidase [Candidatus Neomarinimicrobiota bacterium]
MCFYLAVSADAKTLENRCNAEFPEGDLFIPREEFNAFEHPLLPAVTQDEPRKILLLRWGMVPSWVNDVDLAKKIRRSTLNARSETADEKPSFRNSLRFRRCLIPVTAFYEWQHIRSGTRIRDKIKHKITTGKEIFCLAGIWDQWEHPLTREKWEGFSILTTAANPLMEIVHNSKKRMPVILPQHQENEWLDPARKTGPELKPFLTAIDEKYMHAEQIPGRSVRSPRR